MKRNVVVVEIGPKPQPRLPQQLYKCPFTNQHTTREGSDMSHLIFHLGAQEISRELRASEPEDWVDSMLGGLASGAVLGRVQGGRSRALPMGILFAGVGTGLQLGVIQLREYRLRRLFNALPSESSSGDLHTEVGTTEDKENGQKESSWKLPEWFPIQILTEEEAAKRALEKERKRQNTLKSIQTGELPLAEQRP